MKKICIILSFVFACAFFACSDKESVQIVEMQFPEGHYTVMGADWPIYGSAKELTDFSDLVFAGEVTGIDFEILDSSGEPYTESAPQYSRNLCTVYTVAVHTLYKGDAEKTVKVRVMGGMPGYREKEQLEAIKSAEAGIDSEMIPVMNNYPKVQCNIGEYYLFVLCQFETGCPTIVNVDQSIFQLKEPTKKNTIGFLNKDYYFGNKDAFGRPLISAEDVISCFGVDELMIFQKAFKNGEFSSSESKQ